MTIVFQQEFGKVWTDNLTPYVFTLINQLPRTLAEAEHFFEAQIELSKTLFKKYKEAYLISDFSKTTQEMRDRLCNYYMEYIPRLVKNKISYIAFICPPNAFESLPAEKKEKLSQAPLGIYPTFVEALTSVNLKRSQQLNDKYASIL